MKWKPIEQAPSKEWLLVRGNSNGNRNFHPTFYCLATQHPSAKFLVGVDRKRLSDMDWFPTEYVTLKEFEEWGDE